MGALANESDGWVFGFIWIMVRDLVGGGGKVKLVPVAGRDCLTDEAALLDCLGAMAGGPKLNVLSAGVRVEPSLPWISVEAAGVGGRCVRGMTEHCKLESVTCILKVSMECCMINRRRC